MQLSTKAGRASLVHFPVILVDRIRNSSEVYDRICPSERLYGSIIIICDVRGSHLRIWSAVILLVCSIDLERAV